MSTPHVAPQVPWLEGLGQAMQAGEKPTTSSRDTQKTPLGLRSRCGVIKHLPQDVMDSDGDAAMENGGAEALASNGGSSHDDCAGPTPAVPDNSVCEECEDRRSVWNCKEGCGGAFCNVCFYALHRKGKRALHKPEKIERPEAVGTGGGKGLSGWIGPRLPAQREVANPDMYDRSVV